MISNVLSENLFPEFSSSQKNFSPKNKENVMKETNWRAPIEKGQGVTKNLSYEEWLLIKNS
jgi:hypothetical protein